MTPREIFVPAILTKLQTIDPGEIREVGLLLPPAFEIEGRRLPIRDTLRPGNAFLAKPFGERTGKMRRRMYSRSNCALTDERILETVINYTREAKADASIWWQTDKVEQLHLEGGTVDVRVTLSADGSHLSIYENSAACGAHNLRLEPDDEWPAMHLLALAFSTGITPFLAYLRYMRSQTFGRTRHHPGAQVTLIASARGPRQLIAHEELLDMASKYPDNLRYYPVLTREWPKGWPYGRGRIIRVKEGDNGKVPGEPVVDLEPLLAVVSGLERTHLRFCGNPTARIQLERGLAQVGVQPLSYRSESW